MGKGEKKGQRHGKKVSKKVMKKKASKASANDWEADERFRDAQTDPRFKRPPKARRPTSNQSDGQDPQVAPSAAVSSDPRFAKAFATADDGADDSSSSDLMVSYESDIRPDPELVDENLAWAEETSRRLAIVNCDWDYVRAVDLFMLLRSFCPSDGVLESVKIYPSHFGVERMALENEKGPNLWPTQNASGDEEDAEEEAAGASEDEEEDASDSSSASSAEARALDADSDLDVGPQAELLTQVADNDFDEEKLRQYQLDRLKYFYAVATFDSDRTAAAIYEAVDGTEIAHTSNVFDLRFVPDDVQPDTPLHDSCEQAPASYRAPDWETTALQQSNVKLTWDQTDPERLRITTKAADPTKITAGDLREADFEAYLASSTSESDDTSHSSDSLVEADSSAEEEEEGEEARRVQARKEARARRKRERIRAKYRALLGDGAASEEEGDDSGGEMEITFTPGLAQVGQSLVDKRLAETEGEEATVWQRQLAKGRAKRKARKAADRDGGDDDAADAMMAADRSAFFAPAASSGSGAGTGSGSDDDEDDARAEAELQLLMMSSDPNAADGSGKASGGFKLRTLLQQAQDADDKDARRRRKKKKGDRRAKPSDGFQVDTDDSRFRQLFQSTKFPIDPTNPAFKATPGMKSLLSTIRTKRVRGARERANGAEDVPNGDTNPRPSKKKAKEGGQSVDVQTLVTSIKSKFGTKAVAEAKQGKDGGRKQKRKKKHTKKQNKAKGHGQ